MSIEPIKKLYASMPDKLAGARKKFGRPLTLTEKILATHADPCSMAYLLTKALASRK